MAFKPDYGLSLITHGVSAEEDIHFRQFRLFGLDVLGFGEYSTTSDMLQDDKLYAVSLDFNEVHLERILARAAPEITAVVRDELARARAAPRAINFQGSVVFGVRATGITSDGGEGTVRPIDRSRDSVR